MDYTNESVVNYGNKKNIIIEINSGVDTIKRELVNWKIIYKRAIIKLTADIISEIMHTK